MLARSLAATLIAGFVGLARGGIRGKWVGIVRPCHLDLLFSHFGFRIVAIGFRIEP